MNRKAVILGNQNNQAISQPNTRLPSGGQNYVTETHMNKVEMIVQRRSLDKNC